MSLKLTIIRYAIAFGWSTLFICFNSRLFINVVYKYNPVAQLSVGFQFHNSFTNIFGIDVLGSQGHVNILPIYEFAQQIVAIQ